MSGSAKSMRLKFKGEKKRSSKDHGDHGAGGGGKRRRLENEESDVEEVAWVNVENDYDISGPTFIYHSEGDFKQRILAYNTTLSALELCTFSDKLPTQTEIDGEVVQVVQQEITPQSVHQVWVANRIPGSKKWTFKSAESKFLSCDKFGHVTADSDARGPREEWETTNRLVAEKGLALRSYYGGYLTVDQVAGGKMVIRADTETVGESEMWKMKVQWKYRHQSRNVTLDRVKRHKAGDAAGKRGEVLDEEKLMQAWGSRGVAEMGDKKSLRKAMKEGRLAEAMLDRREKMKR
ncbi:hypothetical protein IE53DRAFT_311301 [Violaceomyces palustris]|uniref:Uncharacterized protein n=1 Tax=Violaceomyces palustris TaxID=1673888 RepID=A0ACD0P481_9BASI|nr:hypothetical protein IE53DRAFT_311301 [Violaceomyces palustris]